MSGNLAPPPFPTSGGAPVPTAQASNPNAPPPSFPTMQVSGPIPPPFPTSGGAPVPGAGTAAQSVTPSPSATPQKGGILRNVAAGALELPQEIANASKWAIGNLNQAGAGVAMGADPSQLGTKGLNAASVAPTSTGTAQIPGVTNYIQNTSDTSLPEQMARGAGEMLPFALAPEADVPSLLARGSSAVGIGASSGAGGYAGQNIAPYVGLSPQAGQFWGNLIGGGVGIGIGAAASKIGLAGPGLAEIAPVTKGMQQQYIASKIRQFAPEAEQQLQATQAVQSGIPGSTLSAAQAAKSPELARLQGALQQTESGVPLAEQEVDQAQKRADFLTNQQFTLEQQKAANLTGVASVPGVPSNLSDYIQDARLQDDAEAVSPVAVAQQSRAAGLSEPLLSTPKSAQAKLSSVVNAPEFEHQIPLQGAISAGDQIRQVAKQKLYQTLEQINPTMDVSPLQDTVSGIQQFMNDRGFTPKNLGDAGSDLLSEATQQASAPTTWLQMDGFRTKVNQAIDQSRDATTGRPTLATNILQRLKRGADTAINTAADREVQAKPETYAPTLAEQARLYVQAKTADERQAILESGNGPSIRPTSNQGSYQEPVGTGGTGSASGAVSESATGLPNAPGSSGVAERGTESGVNPPINQSNIDTYRQALKAHAKQMGLYWNNYIGKMIAPDAGGDFRMPSDQVVHAALPGGKNSRAVALLMRKIGSKNPAALDSYGQAIALSLRKAAVKDGVNVDPRALERWQSNHAGMLSAFPEVAQKVRNIAGAQDMVEKATASREAAMDVYNHKAIQQLLNGSDPETAMDTVMNGAPDQARAFMAKIQKNPSALAGARAAAANNFINRYVKTTAGENQDVKIGRLDQLLTSPRARENMKSVFGPHFEDALRTISADEKATNTRAMMRKSGDSPTMFYREAVDQLNEPTTYLGHMVRHFQPLDAMVALGDAGGFAGRATAGALGGWLRNFSANRTMAAQRALAHTLTSPEATAQALKRYTQKPGAMKQFTRSMAKTFAASSANQGVQSGN